MRASWSELGLELGFGCLGQGLALDHVGIHTAALVGCMAWRVTVSVRGGVEGWSVRVVCERLVGSMWHECHYDVRVGAHTVVSGGELARDV